MIKRRNQTLSVLTILLQLSLGYSALKFLWMHDRNNVQCHVQSSPAACWLLAVIVIHNVALFHSCLCLCLFCEYVQLVLCKASEAKEISSSWPAAILTWEEGDVLRVPVVFDALLLQYKIWAAFHQSVDWTRASCLGANRCSQRSLRKWKNRLDGVMKSKTGDFMRCSVWVASIKSV